MSVRKLNTHVYLQVIVCEPNTHAIDLPLKGGLWRKKRPKNSFHCSKKVSNRMSQKCSECRNVTGRCGPISGRYDCIFAINRSLICCILACLTDCLVTGAAELTRFAHAKRRSGSTETLQVSTLRQPVADCELLDGRMTGLCKVPPTLVVICQPLAEHA